MTDRYTVYTKVLKVLKQMVEDGRPKTYGYPGDDGGRNCHRPECAVVCDEFGNPDNCQREEH